MIKIDQKLKTADLTGKLKRFWQLSDQKIHLIESQYDESKGSPVFTVKWQVFNKGMDRMDTGFSVWICIAPV